MVAATRMEAQCARFEAGELYLPREAPWLSELLHEKLAFPNAKSGHFEPEEFADRYEGALKAPGRNRASGAPASTSRDGMPP